MTSRRPSLPPLPDLSHLTEEERQIIEGVLLRQKEEEEKNCEIVKNLEKEVKKYEKEVDQQNAKLSTVVVESILPNTHNDNQDAGPTCELCYKTKFVDGLGNPCHYCKRKTCARCGGKVNLKPSKFVWACRLCKKKQELLAKTGQWYHGTHANPVGIDIDSMDTNQSNISSHSQNFTPNFTEPISVDQPQLQRSLSKELSRQYSLSEVQSAQRSIHNSQTSQQHPHDIPKSKSQYSNDQYVSRPSHKRLPSIPPRSNDYGSGSPMSLPGNEMYHHQRSRDRQFDDCVGNNQSYQRGGSDNQRHQTASESRSRQLHNSAEQRNTNFRRSVDQLYQQDYIPDSYSERRQMPQKPNSPNLDNPNYYEYSVSHENIPKVPPRSTRSSHFGSQRQLPRITPDMMKGNPQPNHPRSHSNQYNVQYSNHSCSPPARVQSSPRGMRYSPEDSYDFIAGHPPYSHQTSRQRYRQEFRNDSCSSDAASEPNIIRRPNQRGIDVNNFIINSPPKNIAERSNKYSVKYPHQSSYSSSGEDLPTSVECTSCDDRDHDIDSVSDREYRSSHRYNPVRNKVNQINYTNKQPVNWKLSHDKRKLIGHMILQKAKLENTNSITENGSAILGLKIIGGKMTQSGRLGAFITKVKRGSIAHVIGNLLAGDEVLEWNGKSFKNSTYEEVDNIILESKFDPEVELIVRRNVEVSPSTVTNDYTKSHSTPQYQEAAQVQLKLCYSKSNQNLVVTLVQANNLMPSVMRPSNAYCSSFVKLYLLPNRNRQHYQRSRLFPNSNNPRWNQTFIFSPIKMSECENLDLEVLIFDFEKETEHVDVIGDVIIDLSRANLQDIACWYPIQMANSAEESDNGDVSSEATHESLHGVNEEYYESRNYHDRSHWDNTPVNLNNNYEDEDFSMRTAKVDHRNSRSQYVNRLIDYEVETTSPVTKPINHSSHYQDLKYDMRFQISEDIPNIPLESTMRSPEKSRKKPPVNGTLLTYSEEGPRRVNDQRYSYVPKRSIENFNRGNDSQNMYEDTDEPKSAPLDDVVSEFSELSEISKNSLRSDQSDITKNVSPQINDSEMTPRNEKFNYSHQSEFLDATLRQEPPIAPSKSNRNAGSDENPTRSDGFSSDSGLKDAGRTDSSVLNEGTRRKRRPSIGKKFSTVLGFNRKSSSTNNLDKKSRSSFQRSEEVIPAHIREDKKLSLVYDKDEDGEINFDSTPNSINKTGGSGDRINRKDGSIVTEKCKISATERNESHVESFVEGLGPGQLVGRQVLGMPCMGEIQLSFIDRKGHLEVEVIRARNLVPKNNSKLLPQPYIKLHLLEGKMSIEKQRTTASVRKTLDPLYQQQILFSSHYKHKILQVSVWGEHGRMEKKSFMGMCDILLDDLKLSSIVFGWYKLFGMTASNVQHHQQAGSNPSE